MEEVQLTMFGEETKKLAKKVHTNSSGNPIVFRDYESFVAKFADNPKTTDDCYTPQDVYEAVVRYVGTIVDLSDRLVLRPFYPGGDYENAEYPDNGIVIDNPPFSILAKIVRFYMASSVPFFLFGSGMTIMQYCKYGATAVIPGGQGIRFANGALVRINFTTNLLPDVMATTAPGLAEAIKACPSQNTAVNLPKYGYPDNVVSVSRMQTISSAGILFSVPRAEATTITGLDNHPNGHGALFGDHLLVSQAQAQAQAQADRTIPIALSEREKRIVEKLGNQKIISPES